MAFLEKNGLPEAGAEPPLGYRQVGLRGLGAAKISLEYLLTPTQQAQLAANRAAAAAAEAERIAALPQLVPAVACDAASQAAAIAMAKAHGGCVDVTLCDNQGRVAATNRQCWEDPAVKAALVNQIKADEIEAGALERMLEMAKAPEAGSSESIARAQSESAALLDDVATYEATVAQDAADAAAQLAARNRLAALAAEARSRAGRSR